MILRSRKTFIKATELFAFSLLIVSGTLFSISNYLEYHSFLYLHHGVAKERHEIRVDLDNIQTELAGYQARGQTCEAAVQEALTEPWWWDSLSESIKWSQELNEAEVSAFFYINAAYMADFWISLILIISFSGHFISLPSMNDYNEDGEDDAEDGVSLEEDDENSSGLSSSSGMEIAIQNQNAANNANAEDIGDAENVDNDELSTPEEDARYYYQFLVDCYFKSWRGRIFWLIVFFLLVICMYRHIDQAIQAFKLPPGSWVRIPAFACFTTFILHLSYWFFWANAWMGGYLFSWAYGRLAGRPKIAKDDPHAIPLNELNA